MRLHYEDVVEIQKLIETIAFAPSVRPVIEGLTLLLGVVRAGQEAIVSRENTDVCVKLNDIMKKYAR